MVCGLFQTGCARTSLGDILHEMISVDAYVYGVGGNPTMQNVVKNLMNHASRNAMRTGAIYARATSPCELVVENQNVVQGVNCGENTENLEKEEIQNEQSYNWMVLAGRDSSRLFCGIECE